MKNEWIRNVAEFHKAADLDVRTEPLLPHDQGLRGLRHRLLAEEFREYEQAEGDNDIVEIADALADMIYVIIGTALTYGIRLDDVFAEVQRSNMTKCVDGKVLRRADGKILKPDTYSPADIEGVLFPSLEEPAP